MDTRFFNTHAHCFTYDHVPEHFLSNVFTISSLLKKKWFIQLITTDSEAQDLGWIGKKLIAILSRLDKNINRELVLRYMNFIKYGNTPGQRESIIMIQNYYPTGTGLVMLSMDMEYMGAGAPKVFLEQQLEDLAQIKQIADFKDIVYPFVHTDPRRIEPRKPRELALNLGFTGSMFVGKVKDYMANQLFQGIKIYPALGYFPFDKRMKPIYDFALENDIPIMSHCIVGAVHFKYDLDDDERKHPYFPEPFPKDKAKNFQRNFTHPLNFEFLLNRELLKTYWGEEAPDYSNLKICLGHWGGEEEWHRFISDPWSGTYGQSPNGNRRPSLNLDNWQQKQGEQYQNFSWFSIICDMMKTYPNIYADISYTMEDASLLPLLKTTLQADIQVKEKVLFGTDFYLVSKDIGEREFGINLRASLGEELFMQIARENPIRYLSSRLNPVHF